MSDKRAFLIHGWQGTPEGGWRPWLKQRLEEKGFTVIMPAMPNTDHPKMNEWVNHLHKVVGRPDENCIFVGHSLGCIASLRYVESLQPGQRVGAVFLVAGFADDINIPELHNFYETPINWNSIKSHCKKFVAINSDNDPYVPLEHGRTLAEKLGAKLIIAHGMGHMSGGEGFMELPVLLDEILAVVK